MMRPLFRARLLLVALLVLSGWACTETLVGVVDVAVVDITPPSATLLVGESVALQAAARDDRGNTLNDRQMTWASEDPQIAAVNPQGRVSGMAEGATDIIATSEGVRRTARITVLPRPAAANIEAFSGDGQTAVAGSPLDSVLSVRVSDVDDAPVAGVAVTFVVSSGGGSLASSAPVFTNSNGIAHSAVWTLGTSAGANTVTATAAGLPDPVIFTATATQGAATRLAINTQPSPSALNGSVFQRQPVIQVRDASGNAVNQAGVDVTARIASGEGTLNGTITVTTDDAGVARFTDLAITGPEGEKQLEFTAPGVTSVTSAVITITTGSGTTLTLVTQPSSSVQNGVVFARQPVVQLQDAGGTAVAQPGVLVTASIHTGGGTLAGTTAATTNAGGTATFTDLRMTGTVGNRTLQFTASGIAAATSNVVALTVGPASAAHSAATVPGGIAGNVTTITIDVRDVGMNPVTGQAAQLAVSVSGANTASPTVTETGGGSYRATYTPSTIGTDQVAIMLGGTPVGASPYTSTVTASGLSDGNSSVVAAPAQGIVADGVDVSVVTLTLADPFGNPVSGLTNADFSIAVTGSATAGSVAAGSATGKYVFTVTNTVAESITVTVTAAGVQLSQQPTIGFVAGAIDASSSTVAASPTTGIAADGAAASTVTVTLSDANGNPVTGLAPADFVIAATGSAQTAAISASTVPGAYAFTVKNTVAEVITVSVSANGVQLAQQPTIGFVTGGVSASNSTVTASPSTGVTADGAALSTVTIALVDATGNAIGGLTSGDFTVALTGSAQAGTVSAASTVGTYTFTVTNTVAENVAVTVTASGVQLTQQPTIGFVSGPVSASLSSVVSSPTAGVVADGSAASTVTVTLSDAQGNLIGGLTSSDFTVSITGSAQPGTVNATGAPGTYAFAVTNTVAELVTVTVTARGVQLTQRPTIGFSAGGVSASSSVVANPSSGVAADGVAASTVTVTLVDSNGNPVTGLTNAGFTVAVTGSATASTVTAAGAAGTYSFTVTNTVAESVTAVVTAGGVQLNAQPTIDFVSSGVSASRSSAVASPATGVTADGSATSTVTVTLEDATGNAIGGLSSTDFSVSVTGSGQAGTVGASGPAGTYTFTVTNTVAETVTITVTATGVQLAQQPTIAFVADGVAASQSSVSANPTTGVSADGADASTVTVTLADANGNAITGLASGDFTIAVSGNGQAGAVSEGTAGTYTFAVTNTVAETVTVTVTVGGVQLTQQPTIDFVAGGVSASQSSVSANPTTGVIANGADASTVTVTLEDANGNLISGHTSGDFTIAVSGNGQAGAVSEGTAGTYTFAVTNTVAQSVTVTVTVGGVQLTQQPTIGFVPGPISASTSSVTANPTSGVVADGIAASTVTVTLRDANSNPINGIASGAFTITTTGSGKASSVVAGSTAGTYTFTVTDTLPETVTVTVAVSGVTLNDQPVISFVAAGVDPSLSTAVASPTTVTADGVAASTVTVTVLDANGSRVGGLTGADFSVSVSGSGRASAVTRVQGPTGIFEFTVTDTVAEQVTVTVVAKGVTLTQKPTITFVAGAVSASRSTVVPSPATGVTADGVATSTVTVTLMDAYGNPITGLSGAFSIAVSGSGQAGAVSEGAAGTYTFAVSNTVAETVTVTVTVGGVQLTQTPAIDFVAGGVSAAHSNVSANPTTGVTADGSDASTVTVTLADANGNAITGLASGDFTIAVSGSGQAGAVSEGAAGTYTFTVTNTAVEQVTVTVTALGVQLTQQPTIDFVP